LRPARQEGQYRQQLVFIIVTHQAVKNSNLVEHDALQNVQIKIADIIFGVSSDHPNGLLNLEKSYLDFLCTETPDLNIKGHYAGIPDIALCDDNKVFESDVAWNVYQVDGCPVFTLRSPISGPDPYCIAPFSPDFRDGDVYYRLPYPGDVPEGFVPHPLEAPLFHLLMISILAQGYGILVHACGIDDNGRGLLFPASPDFGKTTMAQLWKDEARILNDERVVLRLRDGGLWICGTPWHGDHEEFSTRCVPLEKIYFLNQSKKNTVNSQEGSAAALKLLSHCFHPFWDKEGMQFITDFAAQVTSDVPCYELGFVPDRKVVDFLRCVK